MQDQAERPDRGRGRDLLTGAQVLSGQLGKTIQRLRKAYNLSLSELAEQSGVAKSIISQIERNETNPTLATIWRLSPALAVSIAEAAGWLAHQHHALVLFDSFSLYTLSLFTTSHARRAIPPLSTPSFFAFCPFFHTLSFLTLSNSGETRHKRPLWLTISPAHCAQHIPSRGRDVCSQRERKRKRL